METITRKNKIIEKLKKNPPLFFLFAYALLIIIGSLFLSLPIATNSGEATNLIDAFFVSASAVCVTGLSPVVTVEHWSLFGQVTISLLIQVGGLGIVTAFVAFGLLAKKHFGIQERRFMMESQGRNNLEGAVKIMRHILFATFLIESIGAFLLSFTFIPIYGVLKGIWYSIFHSISSFCNAGFDLIGSESIVPFKSNPFFITVISLLIIVGGLGFVVYIDIIGKNKKRRELSSRIKVKNGRVNYSLHTKLVISITAFLLVIGTVLIYVIERTNVNTIGTMTEGDKILNAFFQSVTTRTAGYFTFDQPALTNAGSFISMVLMFIGGSPGGIAGGIKTTTIVAVFMAIMAEIKGNKEISVFNRNIKKDTLRRAFVILTVSFFWIVLIAFCLTITEKNSDILDIMYETFSAFGTVGLSRNLTPYLSSLGKVFIILTMLFGKLGSLTVMYAIIPKEKPRNISLAEEDVLVG